MKHSLQAPADHGLPALGLVCVSLIGATIVLGTLFAIEMIAKLGGSDRLLVIMMLCAGFVRAGFHHRVANHMRDRSPALVSATRRYVVCAVITTALTIAAFAAINGTMSLGGGVAGALIGLYWPLTLWLLVSRKAIRDAFSASDTFDTPLVPADHSIEGAGVLMTVFSAMGLLTLAAYVVMGDGGEALPSQVAFAMYVVLLVALLGRGVFHLALGFAAMRGLPPQRFYRRSGTYVVLGIVSTVLLVLFMLTAARLHLSLPLIGLAIVWSYFMLVWPMALKRFASGLLFDSDGQPLPLHGHGHAPDRGLSALGYLLLAFTVTSIILRVTTILGAGHLATPLLGPIDWTTALTATATDVIGAWAALELIQVSPRRTLATALFAATAVVTTTLDLACDPNEAPDALGDILMITPAFAIPLIALALVLLRTARPNEATPPHGTPARID